MSELAYATIGSLSQSLEAKRLSPTELLEDVLARIEAAEPVLNAFAHLDIEGSEASARAAEARQMRGERLSPLDGIPTSIKDLIAQKDLPQRFGSRATPDTPVVADAPSVERLRAAGAVLLGKSTTSEFGCKAVGDSPLTGITRNPWNLDKTPGGSSAGAAAMVAAGIVPYAVGTDGGGSLRIPAALTGLVGVKGQFGRIPVYPTSATPTLAHVGPLARTAEDAAVAFSAMAGYDARDPFSVAGPVPDVLAAARDDRHLRIAWSPTFGFARLDEEVLFLTSQAVRRLEALGHTVEEVAAPFDDPLEIWNAEFYAGVGTKLRQTIDETPEWLDPAVLEVLKTAVSQEMETYYATVFARYAFRDRMHTLFGTYDALISPTLPVAGLEVGRDVPAGLSDRSIVSWVFYTYPFNLTGQPAASIPVGFTDAGLPVGLQIAARNHDEAALFALAGQYERVHGSPEQRPPVLPASV